MPFAQILRDSSGSASDLDEVKAESNLASWAIEMRDAQASLWRLPRIAVKSLERDAGRTSGGDRRSVKSGVTSGAISMVPEGGNLPSWHLRDAGGCSRSSSSTSDLLFGLAFRLNEDPRVRGLVRHQAL